MTRIVKMSCLMGILAIALSFPAHATVSLSSQTFFASGTTTFPGTYAGTVGVYDSTSINRIGDLSYCNSSGCGGPIVNINSNPSIFSFYFAGGFIQIQEALGNNGIGDAVDAELDSLATSSSTSPSAVLESITIPFSSGPSGAYTLFKGNLGAGYYAIDTYLAINNVTDPNYQITFSAPEPATLAVLSTGLISLGIRRRKRRAG